MAETVEQRKLRPVYDALEAGNAKQALAACDKVLKKQPASNLGRALKAVALDMLDREMEALSLCNDVKAAKPTDPPVLRALSNVYERHGYMDEVLQLFELAWDGDPGNEELGNQAFMAAARANRFLKQQQMAARLNKAFPKDKYLYWTMLSMLLQAQEANAAAGPDAKEPLPLVLASRMIVKAKEDGKIADIEHLQLYLAILREKRDLAGIAELLASELAQKLFKVDTDRQRELLRVKKELCRWGDVRRIAEGLLEGNGADDWEVLTAYLDAFMHMNEDLRASDLPTHDALFHASDYLRKLAEAAISAKRPLRGPFLAQLELRARLADKFGHLPATDLAPLLVQYFDRFWTKLPCYADLRPYLERVPADAVPALLARLQETLDGKAATRLNRALSWTAFADDARSSRSAASCGVLFRGRSRSGEPVVVDERIKLVGALLELYRAGLPLGADLASSERQHGDDFLLLAAHELVDLYAHSGEIAYLLYAAALLEQGLKASQYNFQMRLLAMRIYARLGAFTPLLDHYRTLDIKHIQNDTLSHLAVDYVVRLASFEVGAKVLREVHAFHAGNKEETPEMLAAAYNYGTLSKVRELINFYQRLVQSLPHALAQAEEHRLKFAHPAATTLDDFAAVAARLPTAFRKEDPAWLDQLRNNRDDRVMFHWNRASARSPEAILTEGAAHTLPWLRLQVTLFQLVHRVGEGSAAELTAIADVLEAHAQAAPSALAPADQKTGRLVALAARAVAALRAEAQGGEPALNLAPLVAALKELRTTNLARYTKAPSRAQRYFHSELVPSQTHLLGLLGYLLAVLHAGVRGAAKSNQKKALACAPARMKAAVTKQLAEAVDELRDAASGVRMLAQAAIGDIEEDLGRSKDDYQRFVQETLLAGVPVASGYEQTVDAANVAATAAVSLRGVLGAMQTISKAADRKVALVRQLRQLLPA